MWWVLKSIIKWLGSKANVLWDSQEYRNVMVSLWWKKSIHTLLSNIIFQHLENKLHETLRNLGLSITFPHQEIRWSYGILRSVKYFVKFLGKIFVIRALNFNSFQVNVLCNTSGKFQKRWLIISNFLMFSGVGRNEHWPEMGW